MSDLSVSSLTVDLLQNQASVALFKASPGQTLGHPQRVTSINIAVPLPGMGIPSDKLLKKAAIDEARKALEEAIRVLANYPV
ncbi:hypothetical protein GOFOIKOB_6321 [Methylobacterium tardum]|uniref:hypothetical protein n=1 Tax=Methylobacterium tardum TaxID=374432 RepID=UPI001EDD5CC4|nr:hypothetical protein [Methylobacterium tardum]URD35800.1 hypothetical protein M6G65_25640 [Methylobacterium tardum]GJE53244.1 hypothetical protein GOFOIKOB_6321 [Methylobacterium tardum]